VSTGGLEGPVLNPCQGEGSHRRIVSLQLDNLAPVVHAEIPASFQAMKRDDMELATDWRAQMRELFETCFARGYQAVDVLKITQDNQPRVFYTLRTTSPARPA
jgi:predicted GNAT superfamily acetyltransferase